ncbi:MAG: DUF938 domain-containing protein [Thalassolituus sp.]|uniref:DUF938 domain-containing protein n=1 Tax=Thalassolituus sp. TaxID=2030822 RepID=UPI0039819839
MQPADPHIQSTKLATHAELPVAESCLRNQKPIADVLSRFLTPDMVVFEVGSGTGQHAAYMTEQLRGIHWQPSELPGCLSAIRAWREHSKQAGFLPPVELDISQDIWPLRNMDAVFSANVVHFVGWSQVVAMFKGISRSLKDNGLVLLYGPYNYDGRFTSEGNIALDEWLRMRDPDSGIKDFEQIVLLGRQHQLHLLHDIEMPANNRMLVFEKHPQP